MRFENSYGRHLCGGLTQLEAGELLGVGERTFRRWSARYREEGEDGLRDRRIGSAAANCVPDAVSAQVEALYRDRFRGFTAKHLHEHLARTAWFDLSYTWTKLFLQGRGLLEAAPRRGAHRRKRPRRPVPGMMLHQDASRHVWVQGVPGVRPGYGAGAPWGLVGRYVVRRRVLRRLEERHHAEAIDSCCRGRAGRHYVCCGSAGTGHPAWRWAGCRSGGWRG